MVIKIVCINLNTKISGMQNIKKLRINKDSFPGCGGDQMDQNSKIRAGKGKVFE